MSGTEEEKEYEVSENVKAIRANLGMIDNADDVARGIAEDIVRESRQDRFSNAVVWRDHLAKWIAAALRSYGDKRAAEILALDVYKLERQKADAEGYRRGLADCSCRNMKPDRQGGGE